MINRERNVHSCSFDLYKMTKIPLMLVCAVCRIYIYLFMKKRMSFYGKNMNFIKLSSKRFSVCYLIGSIYIFKDLIKTHLSMSTMRKHNGSFCDDKKKIYS